MLNDPHRFPRTAGGVLHLFRLSGKRIAPWNLQKVTPRWSTLCLFLEGGMCFVWPFWTPLFNMPLFNQMVGWNLSKSSSMMKTYVNMASTSVLAACCFCQLTVCKESEAQLNARNNTVHKLKESNTDLAAWKHQFLQHANSCLLIEIYYKLIYIHDKKMAPPN